MPLQAGCNGITGGRLSRNRVCPTYESLQLDHIPVTGRWAITTNLKPVIRGDFHVEFKVHSREIRRKTVGFAPLVPSLNTFSQPFDMLLIGHRPIHSSRFGSIHATSTSTRHQLFLQSCTIYVSHVRNAAAGSLQAGDISKFRWGCMTLPGLLMATGRPKLRCTHIVKDFGSTSWISDGGWIWPGSIQQIGLFAFQWALMEVAPTTPQLQECENNPRFVWEYSGNESF